MVRPMYWIHLVALLVSITRVCSKPIAEMFYAGDANFTALVNRGAHDAYLVDFYAPWCGHCKRLEPELDMVVNNLKNNDVSVAIVKVDGDSSPGLKAEYEVRGFPALHLFKKGKPIEVYKGPRMAPQITNYLLKHTASMITELTPEGVSVFVQHGAATHHCVFVALGAAATSARDERTALAAVAARHSTELWFAHLNDKGGEQRMLYGLNKDKTAVVALDATYGLQGSISAPYKEEDLEAFVNLHRWTPLLPLTQATFPQVAKSARPLVMALVYMEAESTEALMQQMSEIAMARRADYIFATVDADVLGRWADAEFGLESRAPDGQKVYPALVVQQRSDLAFYHDYNWVIMGKNYGESVEKFLSALESGEVRKQILLSATVTERVWKGWSDFSDRYPELAVASPFIVFAVLVIMFMTPTSGAPKRARSLDPELARNNSKKDA